MLTATLPALAWHSPLPSIYTTTVAGNGAWGLRIDSTDGKWAIDLNANGPQASSQLSAGAFFFDANKRLQGGFAFTGHTSPNRLIVDASGVTGDVNALPLGITWSVDTPETDAACTYFCLGMYGAAPGTAYMVAWVGGGSTTTLDILGSAGTTFAASPGNSYVLGDPEITTGAPNVQVQQNAVATNAGVKVMKDASATITVANKLYGFWGASDFKLACKFATPGIPIPGACLWKSTLDYAYAPICTALTGVNCWTTQISYEGPGVGGSGSTVYGLLGTPAGAYSFNVDLKVDAYGPSVYNPTTGTFVLLGENYSYLTVADAALPA